MAALARAPTPRELGAEATLSPAAPAATRATLGLSTRMPGPLTLGAQVMPQARQGDRWPRLDATTREDGLALGHDGMAQRWLVVSSQAARERAAARSTTAQQRAWAAIAKPLVPWQAPRFAPPAAAPAALQALAPSWRSPPRAASPVSAPQHDAGTGRPPHAFPQGDGLAA